MASYFSLWTSHVPRIGVNKQLNENREIDLHLELSPSMEDMPWVPLSSKRSRIVGEIRDAMAGKPDPNEHLKSK